MFDLMRQWWQDFVDFAGGLFTDMQEMLYDLVVWAYRQITMGVLELFNQIPTPEFITNGLSSVVNNFHAGIIWTLVQVGFPEAMAILSSGVAFFAVRKIVTLGRW